MENYLEKLCISLGIKLIYANNKVMFLSSDVKDNVPIIRAHKVFKSCTEDVAVAILRYYTSNNNNEEYEIIIRGYIEKVLPEVSYKIKPPIKGFKGSITDGIPSKTHPENRELVEYEVSSISIIEPTGNEKMMNPDDAIPLSEDQVLEMDIVVSQPPT